MNTRYLFLLARDSHHAEDLLEEFTRGDETILSVEVWSPTPSLAFAIGCREAFYKRYMFSDTIAVCLEIKDDVSFSTTFDSSFIIDEDGNVIDN